MVTMNCLHIRHTDLYAEKREHTTEPSLSGCALDRGKRILSTVHPLLVEADVLEFDLVRCKGKRTIGFSLDFVLLKDNHQDHTLYCWINIIKDLIF